MNLFGLPACKVNVDRRLYSSNSENFDFVLSQQPSRPPTAYNLSRALKYKFFASCRAPSLAFSLNKLRLFPAEFNRPAGLRTLNALETFHLPQFANGTRSDHHFFYFLRE